jgi:hypothetical protein
LIVLSIKNKTAMPTNRCSAIVLDKETKRNRKCKKGFKFTIKDCKYCTIHANLVLSSYVLLIQSVFRGNVARRRVHFLKKMPDDIQRKIVNFEREEFFNEIFNYKLSNFLIKKFKKFFRDFPNILENRHLDINGSLRMLYLHKKYINIIQINNDYYEIIFNKWRNTYHNLTSKFNDLRSKLNHCFKYQEGFAEMINLPKSYIDYCLN